MKIKTVRPILCLVVFALAAVLVGPAHASINDQTDRRPFVPTYMEISPATPKQNEYTKIRVFYDLVGPLKSEYLSKFTGSVVLRDKQGRVIDTLNFENNAHAFFIPDAEAMKKDPNFKKWVLTVQSVRFRSWSDSATVEVWLRPLGYSGDSDYVKTSMWINISPDPEALARCVSFLSKKLSLVAPAKIAWVLVGTGSATRIATCSSANCVILEIAQLMARTTNKLVATLLAALNVNNMAGAEDCYKLAH